MTAAVQTIDLSAAGTELLSGAAAGPGRAARSLIPGSDAVLRQTVLALSAGAELADHTAPGPATIVVLEGDVTLHTGMDETHLPQGHWTTIPRDPHSLRAGADAVVLLTVVPGASAG